MKRFFFVLAVVVSIASPVAAQDSIDRKVDSLLSLMTLEEKIGQMNQIHPDLHDLESEIRAGRAGSVLSVVGAEWMNRLQKIAVEETRLGIPLLNGRDVIHGFRTIFPIPLGQAASFNPEIVESGAGCAAAEAYAAGINWTFAPMLDITHDARWGRIAESLGEDPLLAGRMGAAMVRGFQGGTSGEIKGIAACAKHFVGYGAAEGGRDYNSTFIPERRLRNLHLRPFKAVADSGVGSLMTSFNDNDGIPMSGNTYLIRDVLRSEWGWNGMIVSDWASVTEMIAHGFCKDEAEAAYKAAMAGVEVEMVSGSYISHLGRMVKEGKVPMSVIDKAVADILRLKFRLGLFDNPYWEETETDHEAVKKEALSAALESVVMLKNDGRVLPLNGEKVRIIAVTGPLADAPADQLGTWVFDGDPGMSVTPLEALKERFKGKARIVYDPILSYSREDLPGDAARRVRKLAADADVILYFAGEEAILSGEAHCLSTISLQGGQNELHKLLKSSGKPVVSVVMAGRPLAITPSLDCSDALLYAFHPGTMAGPALVDLIFGDVSPSGRLPVTFPVDEGQIPIYYNHNSTGRPSDGSEILLKDIPLNASQTSLGNKSYYLDSGKDPLFPFGYGLTYGEMDYSDISISSDRIKAGETVEVRFTVKNTGQYAASEVVQCYIRDESASVTRPVRELADFDKISLKPGESRDVVLQITPASMGFYGLDMQFVIEPGQFSVYVGPDCTAPQCGLFVVDGSVL